MIHYVYLIVASVGLILLMGVGTQILQAGIDETPPAAQNTAMVNATGDTLELMAIAPVLLPLGLSLLAIVTVFLLFLRLKP